MTKKHCTGCVVHCMDFRIQETLEKLLDELEISFGDYDRISIPGGAGDHSQTINSCYLSRDLHGVTKYVLTVHEDCGAGKTRIDLQKTLRMIKELFPQTEVYGYYIYLDQTWEEVEPEMIPLKTIKVESTI